MAAAAPSLSMAATPSTSFVLHPKSLCFHYSHHHLSTKLNFSLSSSPFLKLKSLTTHLPPSHQFLPSCAWENSLLPTAFSEDEDDEDASVPSPSSSGRGGVGRLYVGNLPYAMTSSQLSELFGEVGRVSSVEIVYDRVTDRSRGFAFVTMASVEEAKHAIRMFDGSQVGGRTVKVNFPEVQRGGEREVMGPKIRSSYKGFIDSSYKIYAGNLAWSLTSQGLREAFADLPGLLSAKVIYERDSGRSRGFGFISFASADEMQSALNAMDGVEVEGRPLRLNAQTASSTPQETKSVTETDIADHATQSTTGVF